MPRAALVLVVLVFGTASAGANVTGHHFHGKHPQRPLVKIVRPAGLQSQKPSYELEIAIAGVIASLLAAAGGAWLSHRLAQGVRSEERRQAARDRAMLESRAATFQLDKALVDAETEGIAGIQSAHASDGLDRASIAFKPVYRLQTARLGNPRLEELLDAVDAFLTTARIVVPVIEQAIFGDRSSNFFTLNSILSRLTADARAGLHAFREDLAWPLTTTLGPQSLIRMLTAAPGRAGIPFDELQEWLEKNPPSQASTVYLPKA